VTATLAPAAWDALEAWARRHAPAETGGAFVGPAWRDARFVPLPNAHVGAAAGDAYDAAPGPLLTLLDALDRGGERLLGLGHVHVGPPAVLSSADRAAWLVDGAPLWPGVALVLGALTPPDAGPVPGPNAGALRALVAYHVVDGALAPESLARGA
jgi:proteasome lid subunit RPN8/RPN11